MDDDRGLLGREDGGDIAVDIGPDRPRADPAGQCLSLGEVAPGDDDRHAMPPQALRDALAEIAVAAQDQDLIRQGRPR